MTDSQKLKLIDVIIANGIEYKPEGKEKAAFLEGIIQAVCAVLEVEEGEQE